MKQIADSLEELRRALRDVERLQNVEFLDQTEKLSHDLLYRPDVRMYVVSSGDSDDYEVGNRIAKCLRDRLKTADWFCSGMDNRPLLFFVAQVITAPMIGSVYHATRSAAIPWILKDGLLPSSAERSATGRADCIDNIYVCRTLGTNVTFGEEPEKGTARWRRWKLSSNNRFNDPAWDILKIRLDGLSGRMYADIWSASGFIIDGSDGIPPGAIEQIQI